MTIPTIEQQYARLTQGPYLVRKKIANYLSETLPYWISVARQGWSLSEEQLPLPQKIWMYEREGVSEYPEMMVAVRDDAFSGGIDSLEPSGDEKYRPTYRCGVISWVASGAEASEQTVMRMRDNMATTVRWCILASKTFGRYDSGLDLVIPTLATSYGTAVRVKGGRWVAASVHSFQVLLDETLVNTYEHVAETIVVEGVIPIPDPE